MIRKSAALALISLLSVVLTPAATRADSPPRGRDPALRPPGDPYERFDVAGEHPEVVARLRAQLIRFAGETGASLTFAP